VLGLDDGQLAELDAGAGHGRAAEHAGVDPQVVLLERRDEVVHHAGLGVGDDHLLLGGKPDEAGTEVVGQVGNLPELVAVDPPARGRSRRRTGRLLLVDADVVPLRRAARRRRLAVGKGEPEVLLLEDLPEALGPQSAIRNLRRAWLRARR